MGEEGASIKFVGEYAAQSCLRNIYNGGDNFIMAFLISINIVAPGTADLDRKLLTGGVGQELALAPLSLPVLGAAGGLVHGPALLGSLAGADLS